jgi:formylmethanofuran dehydrogenase subunit E
MQIVKSWMIIPCLLFAGILQLVVLKENAEATPAAPPDEATYAFLEKLHGHVCAGSLFGVRLGLAAKVALRSAGGEGSLKAVYYDLSCPVDGIQVGAGTTYGNAALVVKDRDEHRLVLTANGNRRQVEARLTKKAEELGLRFRDLKKKSRSLPESSSERKRMEQESEEILDWLRKAPTPEVVTIVPVSER